MGVLNENTIIGASGVSDAYTIDYSCRFNDDDSPYLSRTPSGTGNRRTWTMSFWVKRGNISGNVGGSPAFCALIGSARTSNETQIGFLAADNFYWYEGGSNHTTTAVYRDVTNWYHIVCRYDSTDSTSGDRMRIFINGSEVTSFGTETSVSLNHDSGINNTEIFNISRVQRDGSPDWYADGYMAEFHFVDGTALDHTSFGETGDYGEWKPIEYTGSHGTNGFYLNFANSTNKHAITASGNAQHSTAQEKIGNSSMAFDGTGDYLTIPDHNDFKFDGDYTIECWFYTGSSSGGCFFSKHQAGVANMGLFINRTTAGAIRWQDDKNSIYVEVGSSLNNSAWHHLALVRSGSASSNLKLYIDGTLASTQSGSTAQTQTSDVAIGYYINNNDNYLDGYIDEYRISNIARYTGNFTPSTSAFTEDANTILLIHSDTTNGSTTFTDSSGATGGLGNDASANSNHFAPTNLASSDQVTDTPTNNFPVMNNLNNQPFVTTFAEGNLEITTGGSQHEPSNMATFGMSSGKWYFEVYQKSGGSDALLGIRSQQPGTISPTAKDNPGKSADGYALYANSTAGNLVHNNGYVSYGTLISYTNGDIISIAVDLDNNKCYWAKNGTWLNSGNPAGNSNGHSITAASSTSTGEYFPCFGDYDANSYVFLTNFGQDGTFAGNKTAQGNSDGTYGNFYYSVPSGYKAPCSQNLPEPSLIPSEHFDVVLYTGDGGSDRTITTGLDAVDWVWVRDRANANESRIADTVRGGNKNLTTQQDHAESTGTTLVKSFSGGTFNVGTDSGVNYNTRTYVTHCWKANGSGSSNGDGSITSTVSANTSAGFSIVSYSGDNSTATVGHGLSKAPELLIVKCRTSAENWTVGSIQSLASLDFTDSMVLNTNATMTDETIWNDTAPTSSVFTVTNDGRTNGSGETYIAYCMHSVDGHSKVGSYEGNGDADGAFVYCGFRPAFLLIKNIDAAENWRIFDYKRDPDNQVTKHLFTSIINAESDETGLDFLSNGFKFRHSDAHQNATNSYLYYAVAEMPFKHSNAR